MCASFERVDNISQLGYPCVAGFGRVGIFVVGCSQFGLDRLSFSISCLELLFPFHSASSIDLESSSFM